MAGRVDHCRTRRDAEYRSFDPGQIGSIALLRGVSGEAYDPGVNRDLQMKTLTFPWVQGDLAPAFEARSQEETDEATNLAANYLAEFC